MSSPPSINFCIDKASALLLKRGSAKEALAWSALAIALRVTRKDLNDAIVEAAHEFISHPSAERHQTLYTLLSALSGEALQIDVSDASDGEDQP